MKELKLSERIIISAICAIVGALLLLVLVRQHAIALERADQFAQFRNSPTEGKDLMFEDTSFILDLDDENDPVPSADPYVPFPDENIELLY